jgi:hypothetical protein
MSVEEIRPLWDEHLAARFPKECVGQEIEKIDLMLLDSETAGCISTFINRNGKLDLWRTAVLGLCYRDLFLITSKIEGGAKDYFWRLELLAERVLKSIAQSAV